MYPVGRMVWCPPWGSCSGREQRKNDKGIELDWVASYTNFKCLLIMAPDANRRKVERR